MEFYKDIGVKEGVIGPFEQWISREDFFKAKHSETSRRMGFQEKDIP